MDQRRLECFIAVAEELHFHRAAARVHISQSGLSQQIQQLEAYLDVVLLHRTKRRVALTHAGEFFLGEARRLVRSMGEAVHLAREVHKGMRGHLVVGATAPALYILLPEILDRFRRASPSVEPILRQMTTAEVEVGLRAGDIDVGLVHPPLEDSSLSCTTLTEEAFDVVIPANNPLAKLDELRLEDLSEQRFILFPRQIGPQLYDQILAMCQTAGFSPKEIMEATPAQSIVAMAACGCGIGFIASKLQQRERPLVAFRPLIGPRPYLQLAIVSASCDASPIIKSFIHAALQTARIEESRVG